MKKILSILIIGFFVLAAMPVLAAGKKPSLKTVNLHAINPSDGWGKLTYNISGSTFDFSFSGVAPIANDWYALVVGDDPLNHPENTIILDYPRSGGDTGEISITKSIELNKNLKKAKVWLIWSRDIVTDSSYTKILYWTDWNPQYYLFGAGFVNYSDIDNY